MTLPAGAIPVPPSGRVPSTTAATVHVSSLPSGALPVEPSGYIPRALAATLTESPPDAPTLTWTASTRTLSWGAKLRATSYSIYDDGALVATQAGLTYAVSGTLSGSWTVTATGTGGTSAASSPATIAVLAAPAISYNSGTRTISWSAVTGATTYTPYDDGSAKTPQAGLSYVVAGDLAGSWTVKATAVTGGDSAASNTASVDGAGPPTISYDSGTRTISWSAVVGADSYAIYDDGSQVSLQSSPLSYGPIDGALSGQWTVKTAYGAYRSAASNVVSVSAESVPAAPSITYSPTTRLASWESVATATSYTVFRNGGAVSTEQPGLTYAVPAAVGGDYTVKANNAQGSSAASNTQTASIAALYVTTGSLARWMVELNGDIWVSNSGENTISRVSIATRTIVATVTSVSSPYYICTDGTDIWATSPSGLYKITAATNTAELKSNPAYVLNRGIAWDGTYFWVSGNDYYLSQVNSSGTAISRGYISTYGAVASQDATYAWVIGSSNDVFKITKSTFANPAVVGCQNTTSGLCSDGTFLWVTNYSSNSVTKINMSTNAVVATIAVGSNPYMISSNHGFVWVANYGGTTITRINPSDNSTTSYNVDSGGSAWDALSDGTTPWGACPAISRIATAA